MDGSEINVTKRGPARQDVAISCAHNIALASVGPEESLLAYRETADILCSLL